MVHLCFTGPVRARVSTGIAAAVALTVLGGGIASAAPLPDPLDSADPPVGEAPTARTVQILAINDFHGRIEADPGRGLAGAAVLSGAVAQLRSGRPDTIFASAGDNIGASTFTSFISRDEPTIDSLVAAGLEVSAVGNHEFDYGFADLRDRVLPRYGLTHMAYTCEVSGRPVVQSGLYGGALSRVSLSFQEVDGAQVLTGAESDLVTLVADGAPRFPADPAVEAIVAAAIATAETEGSRPVGTISAPILRGGTPDADASAGTAADAADTDAASVTGAHPDSRVLAQTGAPATLSGVLIAGLAVALLVTGLALVAARRPTNRARG